ncbi:E3 ubiquitin-protein ligase ATL59-like [Tasmannia lanceolata]|uniref:E3 ubiquitin-protein ligase ATL59-like n=1 Tax=Tasmannia lanceolata TaxID=3420 RepID=UPI0040640570
MDSLDSNRTSIQDTPLPNESTDASFRILRIIGICALAVFVMLIIATIIYRRWRRLRLQLQQQQQLAALCGGPPRLAHGLTMETISSLPIVVRSTGMCSVCLSEYQIEGAEVRELPCGHTFHIPCIDPWLVRSATCLDCQRPPV